MLQFLLLAIFMLTSCELLSDSPESLVILAWAFVLLGLSGGVLTEVTK